MRGWGVRVGGVGGKGGGRMDAAGEGEGSEKENVEVSSISFFRFELTLDKTDLRSE